MDAKPALKITFYVRRSIRYQIYCKLFFQDYFLRICEDALEIALVVGLAVPQAHRHRTRCTVSVQLSPRRENTTVYRAVHYTDTS